MSCVSPLCLWRYEGSKMLKNQLILNGSDSTFIQIWQIFLSSATQFLPTYTVCPITLPSSPSVSHCDSLCPENLPRSRLPSVCTSRCCFSSPGERGWPRSRCELPMPPSATFPADVEENERLNEVCYRPIRVLLWLFMQLWAELWLWLQTILTGAFL